MSIQINAAFDSGNIRVLKIDGDRADLEIVTDRGSDFYQWFHFRVSGAKGRTLTFRILNAGGSAYPRHIDFARFRAIADEVGATFMVDMAHFAGLVAAGEHPSPFGHAHVVTTTTHKTLRGPRGGAVFTNDEVIAKKINSAVFPGLQGGPLMHVIAAKAVAFGEALKPSFKTYAANIVANSKALASSLQETAASGDSVSRSAEELMSFVNEIAASTEQVNGNSTKLNASLSEIAAAVEEASAAARSINDRVQGMSTSTTEMNQSAASMAKTVRGVSVDTEGLATAVNESAATIEEMARSIEGSMCHSALAITVPGYWSWVSITLPTALIPRSLAASETPKRSA